jgi:hypothetical protein
MTQQNPKARFNGLTSAGFHNDLKPLIPSTLEAR